jgi:putative salt-induced outer membrane protein YdiY
LSLVIATRRALGDTNCDDTAAAATRTSGIGADVIHRSGHASTRAAVSYLSSAADGLTNARALSVRARQGFEFSQRSQVFGEGTSSRDQFSGIDARTTATLGLGYSPSMSPRHRLTLEAGFGITAEQRIGLDVRFATASGAAHYVWTIAPGTRLTEDATFSADLDSGVNWHQTGLTTISVTLSRLLSLKASNAIEYRNVPVLGFKRTERSREAVPESRESRESREGMRTSAALVLSLRRRPSAR